MPWNVQSIITHPDEDRLEIRYTVERRRALKYPSEATIGERVKLQNKEIEKIQREVIEVVKKELNLKEVEK